MAAPSQLPRLNVYQAGAKYRAALLEREQAAVDDLVRRYITARHQIETELDALVRRIELALAEGRRPTIRPFGQRYTPEEFSASWLYQAARFERLIDAIEEELGDFSEATKNLVRRRVAIEVDNGVKDSTQLLRFRVRDDGLVVPRQFAELPTGALEQITSYVGPTGPIPKAFRGFTTEMVDQVQQRLVDAVATGKVREAAVLMKQDTEKGGILDRPLYEHARVVRTEPHRAYREGGRLTYLVNSDVCSGWEWRAFPGPRTCPYCLAMDGSIHDLTEIMAEHPQGRCTQLPITELSDAPEFSGSRWLYEASMKEQDEVFGGHTMGELYRTGRFQLSDMAEQYNHPDWGMSGRAASMKSLEARGVITAEDIDRARSTTTDRPTWKYQTPGPVVPTIVPYHGKAA